MIRAVFMFAVLAATQHTSAELTATVDRTQVTELDLINLTLRITDQPTNGAPDLSALEKDFTIAAQVGPSVSSRISIINGRQTSESYTEWRLSLRPKRTGNLVIPPIRIGTELSKAIPVEVVTASESLKKQMSEYVFFDTSVDTRSTYVQGEIVYTVQLYYAANISGNFPPPPAISQAVVEPLGAEKKYESIIDGRRYGVVEKRYAIYPQKSGTLVIPREAFAGLRGNNRFFSSRAERVNAVSRQHTIEVKPRPVSFTGDTWLPAESLELSSTWSETPPRFVVGEPVNLTLNLRAKGLPATSLPRFAELQLDYARTYQDPPEENSTVTESGIISTLSVTTGIVPTEAGEMTIPEVRLPWWNTETDRMEVAVLPAQTFQVAQGVVSGISVPVIPQAAPTTETTTTPLNAGSSPTWMYVSIGAAVLWLFTVYLLWSTRRQLANRQQEFTETPLIAAGDEGKAFDKLKRACRANQATEARNALFFWAKARYPTVNSLNDLVRATGNDELATEITRLEDTLYAPRADQQWDGDKLIKLVTDLRESRGAKPSNHSLIGTLNPT
jgi:hypothetical protein